MFNYSNKINVYFLADFFPRNVNEMAVDGGNCYAHLFRSVSLPTMRSDSTSGPDLKYMLKTFTKMLAFSITPLSLSGGSIEHTQRGS